MTAYLTARESNYTDIVPGTEKRVLWADGVGERTPLSIVYLHGFSGSSQETVPFADKLASRLDANLYYTRLTGHGRTEEAMLEGSADRWLADAEESLRIGKLIGERVLVIGVSTGGTLATWLASNYGDDIAALILISPNYAVPDWRARLLRWGPTRWLIKRIYGETYQFDPVNELHARYWTERYSVDALGELMEILQRVERIEIERIRVPLLVYYAPGDTVVDVSAIRDVQARWGAARQNQIVPVTDSDDPSQHVLAGDILSPSTTESLVAQSMAFLQSLGYSPVSP